MSEDIAAIEPLLAEHAEIERVLADPGVHSDAGRARTLGRRYAELGRIVHAYRAWQEADGDLAAGRELAAASGPDAALFAEELPALEAAADAAAENLRGVLVPTDPDDARDVILEVKAGE